MADEVPRVTSTVLTGRILVVDDEQDIRKTLSSFFERSGYLSDSAENGQAAMKCLEREPYDLVITDLKMPIMDGFELITKLRNGQYKFTPILVLTTESELQKKDQGRTLGATGWIVKPFDPEKLVHAIRRVAA